MFRIIQIVQDLITVEKLKTTYGIIGCRSYVTRTSKVVMLKIKITNIKLKIASNGILEIIHAFENK